MKKGDAVWYDSELFGVIKAQYFCNVEGWHKIKFADGSQATVKPSLVHVRAEGVEKPASVFGNSR